MKRWKPEYDEDGLLTNIPTCECGIVATLSRTIKEDHFFCRRCKIKLEMNDDKKRTT